MKMSRHRWTGRYEAHLWDKLSWNATQKKKGKQGKTLCFFVSFHFLFFIILNSGYLLVALFYVLPFIPAVGSTLSDPAVYLGELYITSLLSQVSVSLYTKG